ncbi:transcriptional repressor NrdR [Lichenicola cladoniae]|jgi:transcriptional repressor NrdR|uniref:Transcriptional repressor NrdR n=1 Tax=Lichenicola cladoniae TaxID=1484109 RepID=A0A6M8HNQ0_9PROT|nr:transcriptional regulator NrdR [Lichenicola cladoniae]NPD67415.1 transcriptional repressor NrdR [Acetobacteraceae bacterium]QKE89907.1 transcriptional repressor NrdR [Lichenicola cladoniae]
MRCPFCGHEDTQVKDSRPNEDGAAIRRRRFCAGCGQRFTTIERVQLRELMIAKSDGRRVPFEREKLARSIRIAMRKRPVDEERIERIVNGLVRQLEASGETEIPSAQLGELVMDTLREVDTVAYVRFASVYRDFREARDFETILGSLTNVALREAGTDAVRELGAASREFGEAGPDRPKGR